MNDNIQLFEDKKIRTAWNEDAQEWYFSVVDVVAVLTESPDPNNYWKVLKKRLKDEGNQSVTNCNRLKLKSHKDGKRYLTDVADTEQLLRIIQSIPSPKAEPFKMWLAQVGRERIEETIDPEQAVDRALETYQKKGYSDEWIHQRLLAIRVQNALTDEWQKRGGAVAGRARQDIEAENGVPVTTSQNAVDFTRVIEEVKKATELPPADDENKE